jgi:hypothetical protein
MTAHQTHLYIFKIHKGSCKYVSVLRAIVELAHLLTCSSSCCQLVCNSVIILGSLFTLTQFILCPRQGLYLIPLQSLCLMCNTRSVHSRQYAFSTLYIWHLCINIIYCLMFTCALGRFIAAECYGCSWLFIGFNFIQFICICWYISNI